jgi:hypothetical protein
MGTLNRFVNYLTSENRFAFYLSAFRVLMVFHLLKKVYLIWGSSSFLFSNDSFVLKDYSTLRSLGIDATFVGDYYQTFLTSLVVMLILFMFGIGRNWTALVVLLMMKLYQELAYLIQNGGDNLLIFALMYLACSDSYQYFVLNPSKPKSDYRTFITNGLSNLAGFSIAFHLCLVYFVSAFHKIHADVWFNGVATYYIMNLERFCGPYNHLIVNNGFFVTFSTYFTILVELTFPLFIWNKLFRIPLLISGLGLHLGIYFFMMIYDFQLFYLMIYGFFITQKEWEKALSYVSTKLNKLNLSSASSLLLRNSVEQVS